MIRTDIDIRNAHTCKCGNPYFKFTTLQNKCVKCLAAKGKKLRAKIERKEWKARREKLKTRRDFINEARYEFHKYVRLRDLSAGHTCICCDRPLSDGAIGGEFDAGHFRSVGSAPHLRFDERNVHAQTKHCNRWKGGRYSEYEKGLRIRIGDKIVDELKADQEPRKHSIDDLKALKAKYRALTKELKP